MEADWYYAEGDNSVGPISIEEITRRIRQSTSPSHLVWKPGLPEWTDASTLVDFSMAFQTPKPAHAFDVEGASQTEPASSAKPISLAGRARHELIEYLVICAYLFVCFGSVLLYKAAILRSHGIEFAAFGIAFAKALILGKFLLMLHALKIGERGKGRSTVLVNILKKSLIFAVILIVMTVIEEIIVGYFHGRSVAEVLRDMSEGTLVLVFSTSELLLLTLIPYFGFREIGAHLGEGGLMKLLMERKALENRE